MTLKDLQGLQIYVLAVTVAGSIYGGFAYITLLVLSELSVTQVAAMSTAACVYYFARGVFCVVVGANGTGFVLLVQYQYEYVRICESAYHLYNIIYTPFDYELLVNKLLLKRWSLLDYRILGVGPLYVLLQHYSRKGLYAHILQIAAFHCKLVMYRLVYPCKPTVQLIFISYFTAVSVEYNSLWNESLQYSVRFDKMKFLFVE